jgi:predicted Zn-dependent protease with MMP-like domain
MIHAAIQPIIRRAILDLVADVGGEVNDDTVTVLLNELGHRVGGPDVVTELRWLAERDLLKLQDYPALVVVSSTSAGRAAAAGTMIFEGVYRHKTGE